MQLVQREAIRAILLTPAKEILLMRIRNPVTRKDFWVCPGGGIDKGESLEQALIRELREELGIEGPKGSAPVHRRHHEFSWKEERLSQTETFVVVCTEKFAPVITDEVEKQSLEEFRWWPLHEIDSAKHPITPRELKKIVEDFLAQGAPSKLPPIKREPKD